MTLKKPKEGSYFTSTMDLFVLIFWCLSKVLQADVHLDFEIHKISINTNGSAVLLSGVEGLYIMHLYRRTSAKENTTICR